jgi:hypothetical protein
MRVGIGFVLAFGWGCQPDEGPGDIADAEAEVRSAVGADGDTFVSLVFDGTDVLAYVCDGTESAATTARWLSGPLVDGGFELDDGDLSLTGAVDDAGVDTTLTSAGADRELFASEVTSDAGLFAGVGEDAGAELFAGWIVAPSGEQRGAALVTAGGATTTQPVAALPSDVLAGGTDPIMVIAVSHQAPMSVARIVSPRDPIVSPR